MKRVSSHLVDWLYKTMLNNSHLCNHVYNNWGVRWNCFPVVIALLAHRPTVAWTKDIHLKLSDTCVMNKDSSRTLNALQFLFEGSCFVVFNLSEVLQWLCYCSSLHKRCETWAMAHSVTKILARIWALCFIDLKLRTTSEWNHWEISIIRRWELSLALEEDKTSGRSGENVLWKQPTI